MDLNYHELALLQSYANLLLGSLPAEVKVTYDGATEQLSVHVERRGTSANDGDVRTYREKVATLMRAQAFVEAAIEKFRSEIGTRSIV